MAALFAWLATFLIVPLFLGLDWASGGYLVDELFWPVPFFSSVSWVPATIFYLVVVYLSAWLAIWAILQLGRELDEAGQPPGWAEKLVAVHRMISSDYGDWPIILILASGLVSIAALPALVYHLVSPVSWTLLALSVPTLIAIQLGRTPPPPLPAGVRARARTGAEEAPPTPAAVIASIRQSSRYRGQLRAVVTREERPATTGEPPVGAAPWATAFQPGGLLSTAIASVGLSGVDALYQHQQRALSILLAERLPGEATRNVVLATGPGSGRRLTIFLAALDRTLHRGGAILVVAPDDASLDREYGRFRELAERTDWHYALHEWKLTAADVGSFPDPPPELLFCSLETLHGLLLRDNRGWAEFFDGLDLIVAHDIDRYTGIAGANAAQVFRRLNLVTRDHPLQPQVLATARPANSLASFAAQLFGRTPPGEQFEISVVDAAPRPAQIYALWRPTLDGGAGATPGSGSIRRVDRQSRFDAALELAVMLASTPDLRLLVHTRDGDERQALDLRDALGATLGRDPTEARLRFVTDETELGVYQADYDALLILGAPEHVQEVERLSGRLGLRRNGGLAIVVAEQSPAALAIERDFQQFGPAGPARGPAPRRERPFAERILPLRVDHPLVIEKHLGCAAAETRLTRGAIAATFGPSGLAAADHWVRDGQAGAEDVAVDVDGDTRWDRALVIQGWQVPALYARCHLGTLGADDVIDIAGPAGAPAPRIDRDRAALALVEGRSAVGGAQPLALAFSDGSSASVVAAPESGDTRVAPLYDVSFPAATAGGDDEAGEPTAFVVGPDARLLRRLGTTRRLEVYRLNVDLRQTLVGIRTMGAGRAPIVSPLAEPFGSRYLADALAIAVIDADPEVEERVAHTLQHALDLAIRGAAPAGVLESEIHVLGVPGLSTPEHRGAALLITDGVSGGAGLAAALSGSIDRLLEETYRILVACPCRAGCDACLSDLYCSASSWAPSCETQLDKRAALRFLGEALGPAAEAIAGTSPERLDRMRYEAVADEGDLARIRDRVLRNGVYPLLGLDLDATLPPPARFMDPDEESRTDLAGFLLAADPWRDVVVRPAPEEEIVAVLAHLYAHDWQSRPAPDGMPNLHPSLLDPTVIPFDGRLFAEGVAHWLELRTLDALGFNAGPGDLTFRIFGAHPEGYAIVRSIEDQAGVAGLLQRLHEPMTGEELYRLAARAGVDGALSAWRRRSAAGGATLPPNDVLTTDLAAPPPAEKSTGDEPDEPFQPTEILELP